MLNRSLPWTAPGFWTVWAAKTFEPTSTPRSDAREKSWRKKARTTPAADIDKRPTAASVSPQRKNNGCAREECLCRYRDAAPVSQARQRLEWRDLSPLASDQRRTRNARRRKRQQAGALQTRARES